MWNISIHNVWDGPLGKYIFLCTDPPPFEKRERSWLDFWYPFLESVYVYESNTGWDEQQQKAHFYLEISEHTEPQDLVVDPFVGTGLVGECALELGRNFVGFDINQRILIMCAERLKKIEPQS